MKQVVTQLPDTLPVHIGNLSENLFYGAQLRSGARAYIRKVAYSYGTEHKWNVYEGTGPGFTSASSYGFESTSLVQCIEKVMSGGNAFQFDSLSELALWLEKKN